MTPQLLIALLFAFLFCTGSTCSRAVSVRNDFKLDQCPEVGYSLPKVVEDQMSKVEETNDGPGYLGDCPGFDFYFQKFTSLPYNAMDWNYARIKRGPVCRIEVLTTDLCGDDHNKDIFGEDSHRLRCQKYDPQEKEMTLDYAETKARDFAETLLGERKIGIKSKSVDREVIGLPIDLRNWCSRIQN